MAKSLISQKRNEQRKKLILLVEDDPAPNLNKFLDILNFDFGNA